MNNIIRFVRKSFLLAAGICGCLGALSRAPAQTPSPGSVVFICDGSETSESTWIALQQEVRSQIQSLKADQTFDVLIMHGGLIEKLDDSLAPADARHKLDGKSLVAKSFRRGQADVLATIQAAIELRPDEIRVFIAASTPQLAQVRARAAALATSKKTRIEIATVGDVVAGPAGIETNAPATSASVRGSPGYVGAATQPSLPDGVSAVSQTRRQLLDSLESQISEGTKQLQRLKPGSPERQAAANTIRSLRAQKDEAEKLTDAQIAQMMSDEAAARTRQQAETATAVARTRAAAFPGWDGPWKRCPICDGTGRDADAERKENMQRVSVVGSMTVGTNGITKIPTARIACPLCKGIGQVPDTR